MESKKTLALRRDLSMSKDMLDSMRVNVGVAANMFFQGSSLKAWQPMSTTSLNAKKKLQTYNNTTPYDHLWSKNKLVGGFNMFQPSWKIWVNGKDDIPYIMEFSKFMFFHQKNQHFFWCFMVFLEVQLPSFFSSSFWVLLAPRRVPPFPELQWPLEPAASALQVWYVQNRISVMTKL